MTVRRARLKVRAFFPEARLTDIAKLRPVVESAFEAREAIAASTGGEVRAAVDAAQAQQSLRSADQAAPISGVAAQQTATGTSQLNQAVSNLTALSRQLKSAVGSYQV